MKLGYRVVGVVSLSLLVPGWSVAGEGAGVAQRGAAVAGATGSGVSKGKVRKSDSAPERPADVAQPAGTVKDNDKAPPLELPNRYPSVPAPFLPSYAEIPYRIADDQPRPTAEQRLSTWGADVRNRCSATPTEAPCAALGVASMPSKKSVRVGVGNPVNPQTGQKVQMDLDAEPLDGPLGLEIRRHYNSSLAAVDGALGRAWHLSYDTRLFATRKTIQIVQADGMRRIFWRPDVSEGDRAAWKVGASAVGQGHAEQQATQCVGSEPEDGTVTSLPQGGYRWRWPDGRELDFNTEGWLLAIRLETHVLRIERAPGGRILSVVDPDGRTMRFRYDRQNHLMAIDHPQGTWRYKVLPTGQLAAAEAPSGNRRFYRYEDPGFPFALTAIEVESPALKRRVTLSQWHYDAQGRVRQYEGWQGERMQFGYQSADAAGVLQTEVEDRQGRKQTYRYRNFNGSWQTLSITGQQCAHCRLADRDYRYDEAGHMVGMHQRVDAMRQSFHREFRFERDVHGRTQAVYVRTWRERKKEVSTQKKGPIASRFAETAWQLHRRYEYADLSNPYPTLVERPSVEPGRMYQVRFTYRTVAGRVLPVTLTESGYSLGQPVSRTTTAHYDDKGLLTHIDGPLPGSEDTVQVRRDSDDAQGHSRWTLVDALGREVSSSTDGWAGSSMAWLEDVGRFHAEAGALRHVADNGVQQTIRVDDFNRVVQIVSPDAGTDTIHYDEADRVVRETDATGAVVSFVRDAWDRPLVKTVMSPDGFRDETRYRYEGRWLAEVQGSNVTEHYRHDAQGRVVERQVDLHPENGVVTKTFRYQYTYVGNQSQPDQVTLPDGSVVHRAPRQGRDGKSPAVEVTLKEHAKASARLLYRRELVGSAVDGQGVEDHWLLGNGVQRQLSWNGEGRLAEFRESRPGAVSPDGNALYSMRYGYRADGKVARIDTQTHAQQFAYDPAGRLIIAQRTRVEAASVQPTSGAEKTRTSVGLDGADTLVSADLAASAQSDATAWWYAYDANGNRLFSGKHDPANANANANANAGGKDDISAHVNGVRSTYQKGSNRLAGVDYDAAGRPLQWNGWKLTWHPGGQILSMVHADGRSIRYYYNHRGERVARRQGQQWDFYDYVEGRLQAQATSAHEGMRLWWHEGEIPVAVMERAPGQKGWLFDKAGMLSIDWLHVDHRGLPMMRSDAEGHIVWQQQYGPFGEPEAAAGPVAFREDSARLFGVDPMLRFPGQWADAATGLYYNMRRDYDPTLGRYVSPDPLGLRAGPNPYLYVDADPMRNVDPTGLMLFAFDGTYNAPDKPTNIWHFYQAYDAQANGPGGDVLRPYLEGVGVEFGPHAAYNRTNGPVHREWVEPITADKWKDNVNYQVGRFMKAVEQLKEGETLNIDVVGFSRGAVQALEFGRIIARKLESGEIDAAKAGQVKLRFMGLMDPVFTNMYDDVKNWETACKPMEVSEKWEHVVNIIAAHDVRGELFDGASLGSQVNTVPMRGTKIGAGSAARMDSSFNIVGIREEFMMAGAHSDIGGGYPAPGTSEPDGDLSDIALWVLMERAERAGVKLGDLPDGLKRVDMPVVHGDGTSIEGRDGREILQDGRIVSDYKTEIYGVRPFDRGILSILGLGGNPELEEIGLRRTATFEDYKRMREQGRVAESGMSEGVLVRYINMAVYCDYLKRTQILLDSKYSSYCRQPS